MKKVSLFILLVIVASTLLMAAIPTKMVRLTIINKSGYDVYMKLTGSELTGAFYYLTVPSGDRDFPTIKVFTIMSDVYSRETWQCGGLRSRGQLIVDGNIRLTFTPCFEFVCGYVGVNPGWVNRCTGEPSGAFLVAKRRAGEPRMEKVAYFRYPTYGVPPVWSIAYLYTGYWNAGCALWWWRIRTYRAPIGCQWRYQY